MILNDQEIIECANKGMIENFVADSIKINDAGNKALSFGVSSYGYDVRLANEFMIFSNLNAHLIDPKRLDKRTLITTTATEDEHGDYRIIIPPNSYALGRTIEYFKMPRNILGIFMGKSTYARAGILINVTPIEPGFEGNVVIEIANCTSIPAVVYANEGISQCVFLQGNPCNTSYADRSGKYQSQTGITLPKV